MKNILDTILEHKVEEVANYRQEFQRGEFQEASDHPKVRPFIERLQNSDHIQVIAEIKRGSPSKGLFAPELDVLSQAKKYNASGAGAISVLTDKAFFFGQFDDIKTIRPSVDLPILCKDFIIDEVQIDIAKAIGANLVLLIVAAHTPERLKELLTYAKEKELEVLVEVHNKEELDIALSLNHPLIGINNRNLKTFVTDIQVSLDLIKYVNDPTICLISESGIRSSEDVKKLANAGFKGILVGESLIRNGLEGTLIDEIARIER